MIKGTREAARVIATISETAVPPMYKPPAGDDGPRLRNPRRKRRPWTPGIPTPCCLNLPPTHFGVRLSVE
ncbi:hypothetical protein GCM10022206_55810 [Streptomyces chiangmaiensis]